MSWHSRAECRGYAVQGYPLWWSAKKTERAQALRICARCTVREECLEEGLRHGDKHMIRGGVEL